MRRIWTIGLALALLPAFASAATGDTHAVAPHVWLIEGGLALQPDGNTVVIEAPKGLIVLDTGRHKAHRAAILAFAKAHGRPIVAIVNSHWHLDHVSGNPDLKAAYPGAKVYASGAIDEALTGFLAASAEGARKMMATATDPAIVEEIKGDLATFENGQALRPDVVIDRSQTLSLGGRRIEVEYAPHAATAGDVWLYDPQTKVVATGDLVTLPAPFLDTACAKGWFDALDRVAAKPFVTLVPGHGPVLNRADFELYRIAFRAVIDCARSTRPEAECAADWTKAVTPLFSADPRDPKRALAMTTYYVGKVLRGGNEAKSGCPNI